VELGYRLKRKFWGHGFATEGSIELINKAFNELGALEIFATTSKFNLASQNVMKKVGLKFENEYHEDLFPGLDKRAVRFSMRKLLP